MTKPHSAELTLEEARIIAAWREQLEATIAREDEALADIPSIDDPGTSAGRKAVLTVWCECLKSHKVSAAQNKRAATIALYGKGLVQAKDFLNAGEAEASVLEEALRLFANAGNFVIETGDQKANFASSLYIEGLYHAEKWFKKGRVTAGLREQALRLFDGAGESLVIEGCQPEGVRFWNQGLKDARKWFAEGETASSVRAQALNLFSNLVLATSYRPDWDVLWEDGPSYAREWLVEGEVAPSVREQALRLFVEAGRYADYQFEKSTAIALWTEGLTYVRKWLDEEEKELFRRDWVRGVSLWLFVSLGTMAARQGDLSQAAEFWTEGLTHACKWLDEGETAVWVRWISLRLFASLGTMAARQNDLSQAADFWSKGLNYARKWLAEGETASEVHEASLWLFTNAGANKMNQGEVDEAFELYEKSFTQAKAIKLAEKLAKKGRNTKWLCNAASIIYAGLAHKLEQKTVWRLRSACLKWWISLIGHGCSELQASDFRWWLDEKESKLAVLILERGTELLRKFKWLRKFSSIDCKVSDVKYIDWISFFNEYLMEWNSFDAPDCYIGNIKNTELLVLKSLFIFDCSKENAKARLQLENFTGLQYGETNTATPVCSGTKIQDIFFGPNGFSKWVSNGLLHISDLSEICNDDEFLRRDAERLHRLHIALERCEGIDSLCPPLGSNPQRLGSESIQPKAIDSLLDDLLVWQGLGHHLQSEGDVLLGVFFLHSLVSEEPSLRNQKAKLKQWQETQSPWRNLTQVNAQFHDLSSAWHTSPHPKNSSYWVMGILSMRERESEPLLHRWRRELGLEKHLSIAPELLSGDAPVLTSAFGAWERGNPKPLMNLLDNAWGRARHAAHVWIRLRAALPKGWINEDLRTFVESKAEELERSETFAAAWKGVTERNEREALAFILCGKAAVYLRDEVEAHLRARHEQPRFQRILDALLTGRHGEQLREAVGQALGKAAGIHPETLSATPQAELVPVANRLFAAAIHLHPGPPQQSALSERLHSWSRAALKEAMTGDGAAQKDLDGIWLALETARVALTGLAVEPPSADWEAETTALLNEALAYSLEGHRDDPKWRRDKWRRGWPPMEVWMRQSAKLRGMTPPSWQTCQQRLHAHEALVQLFFDPNSGALQALWLSRDSTLEWRALDDDAGTTSDTIGTEAHWKEQVLDPWASWIDGVSADPRARTWQRVESSSTETSNGRPVTPNPDTWKAILTHPLVRHLVDTLGKWLTEGKLQRLIVLFPAPLAQLPWEALPENPLRPGQLIRAISLTHWRTASIARSNAEALDTKSEYRAVPNDSADTRTSPWTFYDDPQSGDPWALFGAPLEAHRIDSAPVSNRNAGSAEVLAALNVHAEAHLILHGRYQRFAPLRSGLRVRDGQFLPLWLLAAIGVPARLLVLSACESNLSGRTTHDLLGPVGIGPACVAAGASAVLGTLWPCNDQAAVAFIDQLQQLRAEPAWQQQSLHVQVAEAAVRLRVMSGADLKACIERLVVRAKRDWADYNSDPWKACYDQQHPFADPRLWAPFVVLGEEMPLLNDTKESNTEVGR